jgi:hypothetical protein
MALLETIDCWKVSPFKVFDKNIKGARDEIRSRQY